MMFQANLNATGSGRSHGVATSATMPWEKINSSVPPAVEIDLWQAQDNCNSRPPHPLVQGQGLARQREHAASFAHATRQLIIGQSKGTCSPTPLIRRIMAIGTMNLQRCVWRLKCRMWQGRMDKQSEIYIFLRTSSRDERRSAIKVSQKRMAGEELEPCRGPCHWRWLASQKAFEAAPP